MEVLSPYFPQEEAETSLLHAEQPNHLELPAQVQAEDPQGDGTESQDGGQWVVEDMSTSIAHLSKDGYREYEEDGRKFSSYSHESDDENTESSQPFVNAIESEKLNDNHEGEAIPCGTPLLERDETSAVWVKWRGRWQAGIKCERADWPLSTMRAKPTHDRKKYLVIFFPRTRNFSWADVFLVCPINQFPEPIAYKSHNVGVKMVRDLTLPHRFIVQKLAVGILDIFDQLHGQALVETARNIVVWKEFATEASRCKDYPDIGRMLLKFQDIILPCYKSSVWLEKSLQSWVQQCQNANSAEATEMLKEEMVDSILWNDISTLPSDPAHLELSMEWKNYKQEAMKWFPVSNPLSTTTGNLQKLTFDSSSVLEEVGNQQLKKRAKLEVRRADAHPLQQLGHESGVTQIGSGFIEGCDALGNTSLDSEHAKGEANNNNRWGDIIVEADNSVLTPASDKGLNKNRQCIAFIEAKGRQCVRWANDGDVYCCVHLVSRFATTPSKTEGKQFEVGMCEGTTVLGTKCKHRSLIGSSFCKKHGPKGGDIKNLSFSSPEIKIKKRKREEILDVDPISVIGGNSLIPLSDCHHHPHPKVTDEVLMCVGLWAQDGGEPCSETAKRHTLYCDKHLPSWLKRARDGKSRIISKEVFVELLRSCGQSREKKLHLHQACELFYGLLKNLLSMRNVVPKETQFQWAITEASKDVRVREFLLRLVSGEKERIKRHWGFSFDESGNANIQECGSVIRCKICSETFLNDQELGTHWMDNHNKEAQGLFRGYACAICLDSFTEKKVLESHVQERHHAEFVEQCMLFQCIPCSSHFGNQEQLWSHVLSVHPSSFRLSNPHPYQASQPSGSEDFSLDAVEEGGKSVVSVENNVNSEDQKFTCKFCGLKFDLLPDLGRHHQAAHMGPSLVGSRLSKRGVRFYAYKLKSGRLTRPKFKKSLASVASYRIRSRSVQAIKKRFQSPNPAGTVVRLGLPPEASSSLDNLGHDQCLTIAKILFTEMKKTKPRPSNSDILSLARSVCCKVRLQASLEASYGVSLPERIYLKAAKLCSEQNIIVSWHLDGFVCPNGCKPLIDDQIPPLVPLLNRTRFPTPIVAVNASEWKSDESHYVIDSDQIRHEPSDRTIVLCDDISFGRELVPITCVVEDTLLGSLHILPDDSDGQIAANSLPWESFSYVTKPVYDESMHLDVSISHLGCSCPDSMCSSQTCDHTYLFENDYEDARDIHGQPMCGRFPYDERGRIILEEGYVVYECNQWCCCDKSCPNRVLQNGVRVKLEIFKTETKGWAVRAREAILRGTFVCEFIGEVIDEEEANRRRQRYGKEGCGYFLRIDEQINDMSRLVDGESPYVIDATNYGNVSRYINHSCSPNLVNHQVVVESMDCRLTHIGLYAGRDVLAGEELTFDYRYKSLPGEEEEEGVPCLCGSSNCRGRLYQ